MSEVREAEARVARTFQPTLRDMRRLLTDPTRADAALRPALLALMPAEHDLFPSRAAGVRWQLHEKARHVLCFQPYPGSFCHIMVESTTIW